MKTFRIVSAALVAGFLLATPATCCQKKFKPKIKWEREKIAPGLVWKSSHTLAVDSLPQNINVLLVNTRVRTISLVYSHEKNVPASIQASKTGSIAAINGGFFNVRDGGSVTYIKTAGTIVDSDTSVKWRSNSNFNGSVLVDNRNRFYIMPFKGNN